MLIVARAADSSTTDPGRAHARGLSQQLEWLMDVARELGGSPEVTVTFRRGILGAGAQVVVAGIEAVGIGADPHGALSDACAGLADGLACEHTRRRG